MNAQEALEIITNAIQTDGMTAEQDEALAIVQKALEKQIPKKVIFGDDEQDSICCPNCKGELLSMDWYDHWKCNYCEVCGQALDWSDTE